MTHYPSLVEYLLRVRTVRLPVGARREMRGHVGFAKPAKDVHTHEPLKMAFFPVTDTKLGSKNSVPSIDNL